MLKPYPRFATIFMGKWMAGRFDIPTPNALLVDQRVRVAPNGVVVAINQAPYKMQPYGAKVEHEGEGADTTCQD